MSSETLTTQHHHHDDPASKVVFGFWIYIMTDCILFAALFATYAVLHNNTYGSAGIQQVASLPYILLQSLILLFSTFSYGLCSVAVNKHSKNQMVFWLLITFLLGLGFVGLNLHEFSDLLSQGYSWQSSAFFSSFFSLVGIYNLHIVIGLLWIIILLIQFSTQSFSSTMKIRFTCLGLFWNFLNILWIFIFTIVYLMGAI